MQIMFNGKTYNSLEEMPANERQAYEQLQKIFVDADGNGIPDFMEGDMARNVTTAVTRLVGSDGQVYNNLDALPPEKREKVEKALAKLNQMGLLQGGFPTMNATVTTTSTAAPSTAQEFEPTFAPSKPLVPQEPAISEVGRTRGLVLIIAIAVALFICSTGAALFLFAR